MEQLYNQRLAAYRLAHFRVDAGRGSVEELVDHIVEWMDDLDPMRYLVISDIHANLEAYETVMAEAATVKYDRVLVLGDLVGYGADPNAVCERVRALAPHALIRGNHDKVGSGVESPEGFNAVARNAIRWTFDNADRTRTATGWRRCRPGR